jgi:threonine dehydrogenase-like Zn-dependent dehydrogenase
VIAGAEQLFPVPDAIADDVATLWQVGRIAFNGMRRGQIQMGESVAVFGLGIIGQLRRAQLARLERRPAGHRRGSLAAAPPLRGQCGFDLVLDGAAEDLRQRVEEATCGRMLDCVLEVTGVPALIPREMELLHKQGRIVIISSPRGKTQFDFHDYVNSPSLTIIGAHNNSHPPVETWYNQWTPQRNVELLFDLMAAGEVRDAAH